MIVAEVLGGRYSLQDRIGAGGMAVVWRARDEVLGRQVAVKVLAGRHVDDPVSRRRIWDEARAAAVLSHPNIAQVHDFGEEQSADGTCTPYVVMELVPGGTLAQRMAAGPVPVSAAFRICAQVAAALAAAHADGLVHRDIKPANVMVTPSGAKVVDFGIAAAISADGGVEPTGERFGTPAYLAPERLLSDSVEPASDVYALGLMLYRLLAGHPPWSVDTTTKMLAAHVYVEPTPLPQLPKVPPYVTELVNRCLLKDPTMRPAAGDVAAVLARAAAEAEPAGGQSAPVPMQVARRSTPAVAEQPAPPAAPHPAASVSAVPQPAEPQPAEPQPAVPAASAVPVGRPAPSPVSPAAPSVSASASATPARRRRVLLVAGAVLAVAVAALVWLMLPGGRLGGQPPGAAQADPGRAGNTAALGGADGRSDQSLLPTVAVAAAGTAEPLSAGLPQAGRPTGGVDPRPAGPGAADPGAGNPGPGDPGPGPGVPEATAPGQPGGPQQPAPTTEPAAPQEHTL
ncbi:MAG TPA: serine/threonine-protein kinase, partial [Actinoplanes sp.]|nr:serine/threonine-protein kinase [Actinoplanes sp.]